ncbi:DUF2147 domain-containing protein [Christiangramia fulva]|uniref:DUF2147 domain-containing protein n=1 Tax=Christiangramia fulva TaxID=2126553 RepID=A0A2R3ZB67_9FLAO|nr:DUF2147 domain-containing protein [Christiangramia fulva]AVR47507.1 DUF2147 domain-containing protein [Christiangramia fulva]
MKNILTYLFCMGFLCFSLNAQDVTGKWKNFNSDGKVNSIIKVYKKDGKIYGKVVKIMKEEDRDRVCTKCDGELKNKPIEGMVIMRGLHKEGDKYVGGHIVDPKKGKEYRCKIWLKENNPDLLKVRGYLAFFYKTKTWERVE